MRLARPVCDAEGRPIAGAGTVLDERVVRLLRRMAVQSVAVVETDDVRSWETEGPLADELRALEERFRAATRSAALDALHDAIARHLKRRAAATEPEA
jgi:hypothetical protein